MKTVQVHLITWTTLDLAKIERFPFKTIWTKYRWKEEISSFLWVAWTISFFMRFKSGLHMQLALCWQSLRFEHGSESERSNVKTVENRQMRLNNNNIVKTSSLFDLRA